MLDFKTYLVTEEANKGKILPPLVKDLNKGYPWSGGMNIQWFNFRSDELTLRIEGKWKLPEKGVTKLLDKFWTKDLPKIAKKAGARGTPPEDGSYDFGKKTATIRLMFVFKD